MGYFLNIICEDLDNIKDVDYIDQKKQTVNDIMIQKPITVDPSATILEALNIMRTNKIGCLPVVKNNELIGIITEMDFLRITGRLLNRVAGKKN